MDKVKGLLMLSIAFLLCSVVLLTFSLKQVNPIVLQGQQGIPGIRGEQGMQGSQGVQGLPGVSGEQGLQGLIGAEGEKGEQGEPGPNLVVAMGYIYEDNSKWPIGSPKLISEYNVDDVVWNSDYNCYLLTLEFQYDESNHVTLVTPRNPWMNYSWCAFSPFNYQGKLAIQLRTYTGETSGLGSFQFVVLKYP